MYYNTILLKKNCIKRTPFSLKNIKYKKFSNVRYQLSIMLPNTTYVNIPQKKFKIDNDRPLT